MTPEESRLLRDLLTRQRVLSLAVLLDGAPYVGLLAFAARPDLGALLVHASRLARHTRGLTDDAPFGALVRAPDRPGADPLQLPRVSLEGRVRPLPREGSEFAAARDVYLAKLPESERVFRLGDFRLYELAVERGRYVAGFGSIHTLNRETLRQTARTA